jgi:hypothetical protein
MPLFLAGFVCLSTAFAGEKVIHLRSETIRTTEVVARATPKVRSDDEPASGLYLIQFTNHFQQAWGKVLAARHVELLQSVPEDAFIVRISNVKISALRALDFIQWVGKYEPRFKLHERVARMHGSDRKAVSVLLAGSPALQEVAILQKNVKGRHRIRELKSGSVMDVQANSADIKTLSESTAVLWVEPAPKMQLFDEVADQIVEGPGDNHKTEIQALGYTGEGVTVAVADSGLNNGDAASMHPDLAGRVDAFLFYGALTDASDEHSHGTHVTGIVAGDGATGEVDDNGLLFGLGMAPKSHIVVQRIFDGDGNYEAPPSYETLTHDATRAGAVIGSNSWGDDTQGRYDISAMEFDARVRDADDGIEGDQPYILEFSAGNAGPGPQTIGSPAVAKNVIATGASENDRLDLYIYDDGIDTMADFSSRGPCEDGRIKPDLVAPGTWISSLRSAASSQADDNAWASISPNYIYVGGTSQAGPHVSGAAAVFVQYYRQTHDGQTPSPALVKAALINSAADMPDEDGDTEPIPNNDEGWGRLDLAMLLNGARKFDFFDQTNLLTTGNVFEKRFFIGPGAVPLKVTLTYTDVPAFPGAIPALVNDLDLEVVSPAGIVYHGNQFLEGESVPNPTARDSLNNVEGVHLATPEPGDYIVRVRAANVPKDARRDTAAVDQDFALVISGDIPLPGHGFVTFDRKSYTAPDRIGITLVDTDLFRDAFASVVVSNLTHPQGIFVALQASGGSGVFTGSVTTASSAAGDTVLQISHRDLLEVFYNDASTSKIETANAVADLVPPVISDVSATNRFASEIITWITDEPADSTVICLTNGSVFGIFRNASFEEQHSVVIKQLIPEVSYQYYIVSKDEAGNATTNNNNGKFFSFVAAGVPTVLLVNNYVSNTETADIPVTAYTDALDQTGVSYEVWDETENGSPPLDILKPYRVVIWRINDSIFDTTSITAPEQTAIEQYLNDGGSFFMSSMEILSRLGPVAFRTNVLQVQGFTSSTVDGCVDCDEDHSVPSVEGVPFDAVAPGLNVTLDYSAYENGFIDPDVSDTFTAATNAVPFLFEPNSGRTVGVRYPRPGQDSQRRVVFLSIPLDGVPMEGDAPNNRANLMKSILAFLAPGLNGVASIVLNNTQYTAPSQLTVEVGDSDLASTDTVTVQIASDSAPSGREVRLQSTVVPGLFRGFLSLTTNAAPATNELTVKDGDTIIARYHDLSPNNVVEAAALIDLRFPAISDIVVDPDYQEAEISWETSEPTDSLVQFGESTFLGRTAYSPALETSHDLTLIGLKADRTYFYQVVSRDLAGNTRVDDNGGRLYSFVTPKPFLPPWSDDFEHGSTNWSVQNADDPGMNAVWKFGQPSNELATEGHSGTNVWGTNLRGAQIDEGDSFLVGPAVLLTGGTQATLKFWHNYDFSGEDAVYEYGQLLILTNAQAPPTLLDTFQYDASGGWQEAKYDLTPYVGSVIQLVWEYFLLDLEANPHPGWLLDDVSLTVTNEFRGVIKITNNLAGASFRVEGAANYSGSGFNAAYTNAPAGDYVITFGTVPYYTAPPPQTNSLSPANPLILWSGVYSFPDTNFNSISDLWEQQNFGTISATRTRTTDTDGDGMADYAEFVAGTDPNDSQSRFEVSLQAATPPGKGIRLEWNSVLSRSYRVWGSENGVDWAPLGLAFQGNAGPLSYTVPDNPQQTVRFFKIEVSP